MPELMVSVVAAFHGSPDVAVGNVVGSNIFNLALVLGICAVAVPLPVPRHDAEVGVAVSGHGHRGLDLPHEGDNIGRVEGAALLGRPGVFVWSWSAVAA